MSIHRFEARTAVAAGLDEVWSFFSDPGNLAAITPPELGFQIRSNLPERVYPGLIVVYRVQPLGPLPTTWVTEITYVDEGRLFVDEQRAGPYRLWHHEHHFRAVGDATVDRVRRVTHAGSVRSSISQAWSSECQAM
ncbi:MAG: hypothetical protein ACE5EF_02135 [Dehalococcoidia bacterium]